MNNDIFNVFTAFISASNRVYELTGVLTEKVKAYREENDIEGADAISNVVIDDIEPEVKNLYEEFNIAMEVCEKQANKLKNVCAYYGINIQLGKNDNVIKLYKSEDNK